MNIPRFICNARTVYTIANVEALEWLTARPLLHGVFLNSKQNSITLHDYGNEDRWRGPETLYGWIQGRCLEALVRHARFIEPDRPALAARLYNIAWPLYSALAKLYMQHGQAYFSYDSNLEPVCRDLNGDPLPQRPTPGYYTFSDIFVVKGLIAASYKFDYATTITWVGILLQIVEAVEQNHFLFEERVLLAPEVINGTNDYASRMILIGAAALLRELGFEKEAAFGNRFINYVLRHHVQAGEDPKGIGIVRNVPDGDRFNPGHAIEFAGFSLQYLPRNANQNLVNKLEQIITRSFHRGFQSKGISLSVSVSGNQRSSTYYPWWSLPETIRAAALAFSRTGQQATLKVWKKAHDAFFAHYWRNQPPIAYQTISQDGPIDYVPATPDLDPSYHTGLSFLGAIRAIDVLTAQHPQ